MRVVLVWAWVVALALAAACGDDGDAAPPDATAAPDATPTRAVPSPSTGVALTYIIDDTLWMIEGDGPPVELFDVSICPKPRWLYWSPDRQRLLCHANTTTSFDLTLFAPDGTPLNAYGIGRHGQSVIAWSPLGTYFSVAGDVILIIDPEGRVIEEEVSSESGPRATWSSDGNLAYWSGESLDILVFSHDNRISGTGITGWPLAWVLDNTALLIAEDYQPSDDVGPPTYDAVIIDLETRGRRTVDLGPQFWISPDGRIAATTTDDLALAFVDLATGDRRVIAGSSINFPGHQIPAGNVHFTPDGASLYWVDVDINPTTVNRVDVASGETSVVASLDEVVFVIVSPDGSKMAYAQYDADAVANAVYLADIDGSGAVFVGHDGDGTFLSWAWR